MSWPYLEAIVVRDAAVTTWVSVVGAPISGYTTRPLYPGSRVGKDGRIATITDRQADSRKLAEAQARSVRAASRVVAQAALVEGMKKALATRAEHADDFASTFAGDLDAAIAGARASVAAIETQLTFARTEAERAASLKQKNLVSQASLDAARASVADLERELADTRAALLRASERHGAAKAGVFLLEDGTDGNSAFQNLSDARLRLIQAESALTQMRAEEIAAKGIELAARVAYEKSRSLDIQVPPGAMVWTLISGPGAPVQPGSPVASWIDCSIMLVDVPLSDVETALLREGSLAEVVLEGERAVRRGTVILTRGSAGTLGSHDLAALAKGRRAGLGQAIVRLESTAQDMAACPIGHAAYVDFPDVGAFQILKARLRW